MDWIFAALTLLGLALAGVSILAWRGAGQLIYPPRRRRQFHPSTFQLDYEPVEFNSRDGMLLRGWFIPADNAKGTIVLTHGYSGECSPDLVYAPLLKQAGYNTLYFDFRAHGESAGGFTSLAYFERLDLLGALDYLKQRGIARVGVIGFSMGGAVAMATAPQSAMIVAVIADCAFAQLDRVMANTARARGAPRWLAPLLGWLVVCFASVRLRANLFLADPLRWVSQISPRPLLIMHAENDSEAPVEQAYRLFQQAREPKELWVVPGAEHRRIEEVAGAEYRRRVVAFFDGVFESAPPQK